MFKPVELNAAMNYASSATDWLPECSSCRQIEMANDNILSPRKSSFKRIPDDFPNGMCVDLEVSFDTQCNAACMSCGGSASSTWRKFERKHKLFPYTPEFTDRSDEYLQKLISTVDMSQVLTVTVQGGEPFFSDSHVKLLGHLTQVHDHLDQVTLRYSTNGSIFPPAEVRELWKKFKRVIVSFSIDGIKEKFEYLRWPLRWHDVETVVYQFVNETDVWFSINYTMSPLNVMAWNETADWISAAIPEERVFGGEVKAPTPAFGIMDLTSISHAYRDEAINYYGKDHAISIMLSNMGTTNRAQELLRYLDKIDQLRGNSWRAAFPDAVQFLDPPVV